MSQAIDCKIDQVRAILESYNYDKHNLVAILQEVQEIYRCLPEDVMTFIATELKTTPGSVFGVATFYSHFTLNPKGKYIIKVCDGTACHVKKSTTIIKALETELGLTEEKKTSDDMLFTLEAVACLGACGLAPVVVINEDVYGSMTPEKTLELVKKIREEEQQNG